MANVEVLSQLYNVGAVFVSPSPATAYMFSSGTSGTNLLQQVPRIQSVGVSFSRPLEPINQFGQAAALDRIQVNPATVSLSLDYYLVDGKAENVLGLNTAGNSTIVSGLLDRTTDEKNYFLQLAPEGVDAIGANLPATTNVLAVGNGFVTNYSLSAAIGQVPRATVAIEGSNFQTFTGSANNVSPAIDPNTDSPVAGPTFTLPTAVSYTGANIASALRPGEIILNLDRNASLGDYLTGVGSAKINGFTLSVPVARDTITKLGHFFPIYKKVRFPLDATLSLDAMAGDVAEGALSSLRCADSGHNFNIVMQRPNCGGFTGTSAIIIDVKNAKLDSRDWNMSVGGGGATVRLNYSLQIAGIGDTTNGVFFSGSHA